MKRRVKTIEWERLEIPSKKIRNIKEIFHAKMGTIKNQNGMGLREAEDIKMRWQEYTENCTKKIFTTQIITVV